MGFFNGLVSQNHELGLQLLSLLINQQIIHLIHQLMKEKYKNGIHNSSEATVMSSICLFCLKPQEIQFTANL